MCKCKLSVTGCGHISYSWPGEARILPIVVSYKIKIRSGLRNAFKSDAEGVMKDQTMSSKGLLKNSTSYFSFPRYLWPPILIDLETFIFIEIIQIY